MVSQKVGAWAFILGVVIAIIAGLVSTYAGAAMINAVGYVALVLVVLGLIVGFLNVRDKEVVNFLIAAIALLAVGSANLVRIDLVVPTLGTLVNTIIANIQAFVFPAALVVALKEVWNIASEKI